MYLLLPGREWPGRCPRSARADGKPADKLDDTLFVIAKFDSVHFIFVCVSDRVHQALQEELVHKELMAQG